MRSPTGPTNKDDDGDPRRRRMAWLWSADALLFLVGCVGVAFAVAPRVRAGESWLNALLNLYGAAAGVFVAVAVVGVVVLVSARGRVRGQPRVGKKGGQ